jgi:hypothetical protein
MLHKLRNIIVNGKSSSHIMMLRCKASGCQDKNLTPIHHVSLAQPLYKLPPPSYPCFVMRFRAKPASASWLLLVIAAIQFALALGRILPPHHSQSVFEGFIDLFTGLLWVLIFYIPYTTFWEFDADGLKQRRLWIDTRIGWREMTRVVNSWSPTYDLKIEYQRHGFGSKIGRILASPRDRDQFLDALHRFAPQAQYIDESSTKILNI